jgi:hypothetical protein
MNFQTISQTFLVWMASFGLKVLGAIAIWVDLEPQLDHSVDVAQATQMLKQRLRAIPNVTIYSSS